MVAVPISIVLVKRPIKSPLGVISPLEFITSVVVRPTVPTVTFNASDVDSAK